MLACMDLEGSTGHWGGISKRKAVSLKAEAFFIIVRSCWSEGLFIQLNSFCFVTLVGILRCLQLLVSPMFYT